MNRPMHFDAAKVLAEHAAMLDRLAAAAPHMKGLDIQLRIGRKVGRAFIEFLVEERNLGTDGLVVAQAVGVCFAGMIDTLVANYPGPMTGTAFAHALQRAKSVRAGEDEDGQVARVAVNGVRGGNA